jgi:hypothetical protein
VGVAECRLWGSVRSSSPFKKSRGELGGRIKMGDPWGVLTGW